MQFIFLFRLIQMEEIGTKLDSVSSKTTFGATEVRASSVRCHNTCLTFAHLVQAAPASAPAPAATPLPTAAVSNKDDDFLFALQ